MMCECVIKICILSLLLMAIFSQVGFVSLLSAALQSIYFPVGFNDLDKVSEGAELGRFKVTSAHQYGSHPRNAPSEEDLMCWFV